MSIEDIRALKHAKPFGPFEFVTKQGERILISSPIRIALSPTGNSVFVPDWNGSSLLPISEISSVRTLQRRNAKSKGRVAVIRRLT